MEFDRVNAHTFFEQLNACLSACSSISCGTICLHGPLEKDKQKLSLSTCSCLPIWTVACSASSWSKQIHVHLAKFPVRHSLWYFYFWYRKTKMKCPLPSMSSGIAACWPPSSSLIGRDGWYRFLPLPISNMKNWNWVCLWKCLLNGLGNDDVSQLFQPILIKTVPVLCSSKSAQDMNSWMRKICWWCCSMSTLPWLQP